METGTKVHTYIRVDSESGSDLGDWIEFRQSQIDLISMQITTSQPQPAQSMFIHTNVHTYVHMQRLTLCGSHQMGLGSLIRFLSSGHLRLVLLL